MDLEAGQLTQVGNPGNIAPAVGIYSAYVSYLAPLFNGVQIDAGIMPTIIGWEVEQQNANWNITRGATWGLQPVTNVGALVTVPIGNFTVQVGALNNPIAGNLPDTNNGKAITSKLSYGAEKFGASVGVNWGSNGAVANPTDTQSEGIVDVILWVDPLDNLSAYINYDYVFQTAQNGTETSANAVAVGARLGIIDSTGIAARFEYIADPDGIRRDPASGLAAGDLITLTGTVDHQLTNGLTLKAEVRWDHDDVAVFPIRQAGGALQKDQVVALAQLLYEF